MKKKMLVLIILILILVSVTIIIIINKGKLNNSYIETEVNYFSFLSYSYNQKNKIISTFEDCKSFIESNSSSLNKANLDRFDKYDKKFFETKSLAIVNLVSSNSASSKKIEEIIINGDTLDIKVSQDSETGGTGGIGLTVMSSTVFVFEVNKNVEKINLMEE